MNPHLNPGQHHQLKMKHYFPTRRPPKESMQLFEEALNELAHKVKTTLTIHPNTHWTIYLPCEIIGIKLLTMTLNPSFTSALTSYLTFVHQHSQSHTGS
jgi:hypothetical protein